MNIIFFDDSQAAHLQPLTLTRPAAELHCGALTNSQRIQLLSAEMRVNVRISYFCDNFLSLQYQPVLSEKEDNYFINGRILADKEFVAKLLDLPTNTLLIKDNLLLAARLNADLSANFSQILTFSAFNQPYINLNIIRADFPIISLNRCWDLFLLNDKMLKNDFALLTKNQTSREISPTNTIIGDKSQIFISEGAIVEAATINCSQSPIFIGKNAEIMEGATVRNGLFLGENACLKMGAKIYGATTIAAGCKIGGEVSNSVIFPNTNKAHDGFLGNSVLGSWVNLGADTNNSNLKNTYGSVQVWDYPSQSYQDSGQQFCGLVVGDHSKFGINSMLNTGTVVGVFANVFGAGFPPKFVRSFSWGDNTQTYQLEKALEVAETVMSRRKMQLSAGEKAILAHIFGLAVDSGLLY